MPVKDLPRNSSKCFFFFCLFIWLWHFEREKSSSRIPPWKVQWDLFSLRGQRKGDCFWHKSPFQVDLTALTFISTERECADRTVKERGEPKILSLFTRPWKKKAFPEQGKSFGRNRPLQHLPCMYYVLLLLKWYIFQLGCTVAYKRRRSCQERKTLSKSLR